MQPDPPKLGQWRPPLQNQIHLLLACLIHFLFLMLFSAGENKPIWMHAEEREEQSKVSREIILPVKVFRALCLAGFKRIASASA